MIRDILGLGSSEVRVGLDPSQEERHTGVHRRHADRATGSRTERHNTDLEASTILDGQRATRVTVAGRATTLAMHAHVLRLDQDSVPAGNTVSVSHDRVAGEHHDRRSSLAGIRRTSESGHGSGESSELAGIRASWQTSRLDTVVEHDRRVQANNSNVIADVGRSVCRVGNNAGGRESDTLLARLLNVTVVCTDDGSTSGSRSRTRQNTMGSGQDVVVGEDGTSAQTGTTGKVAQQSDLVRELTGSSFLAVGDTMRRSGIAVDLHLRWQTRPVVIEVLDRSNLRPIDVGAGRSKQSN
uniref:Uncharacterized protein n=1 Tax=Anopheles maculatus TaxID=74869 RepID=A0A182SZ64_9DIPT